MKMKKLMIAGVLALGACGMLAGCGGGDKAASSAAKAASGKPAKIVAGMDDTFAPMGFRDEQGNLVGFDIDLATAVADELGMQAEFKPIDWNAKEMELKAGTIDCVWNGMTLTDDVLAAMDCTDPYIKNAQVVVMAANKLKDYPDTASMKELTFAAESGSAGAAALEEAGLNCTPVSAQSDALLEVKSGSVDACVIDITMAKAMTGEGTSYADLGYSVEMTSENYGIGFRKGSDLTAKVNEITKELTDSGFMDTIGEKYGLKDNLTSNLAG